MIQTIFMPVDGPPQLLGGEERPLEVRSSCSATKHELRTVCKGAAQINESASRIAGYMVLGDSFIKYDDVKPLAESAARILRRLVAGGQIERGMTRAVASGLRADSLAAADRTSCKNRQVEYKKGTVSREGTASCGAQGVNATAGEARPGVANGCAVRATSRRAEGKEGLVVSAHGCESRQSVDGVTTRTAEQAGTEGGDRKQPPPRAPEKSKKLELKGRKRLGVDSTGREAVRGDVSGGASGEFDGTMEEDAWLHLPSDLLSNIALWLAVLSESTACVLALGSTCRTWRRIVSQDRRVLRVLPCQLDLKKPFKAALAGYASMLLKVGSVQLPRLVYCAAHEGNPDAAQLVARVLDEQREPAQALTFWKLAAKGGDAHAQHVVGMAFYKGARGAVRDPEQAHMWLTRAVKQELIRLAASAAEDARSPNEHSASELLADCCLVLGYIAFDGEGCKSDTEAATRWFRMSVKHGGREAEGVLGWIFNTGQYG